MKMDVDLLHSPAVGLAEEEEPDLSDWKLPLAFMKKRHSEKIEGSKALAQSWRMKDRVIIFSFPLSFPRFGVVLFYTGIVWFFVSLSRPARHAVLIPSRLYWYFVLNQIIIQLCA